MSFSGESLEPKYKALPLELNGENKRSRNCYLAKLEISNLDKGDERLYTLVLKSKLGEDSTKLKLIIRDPSEMRLIAAATAAGSVVIFLLVSIAIYFLVRMKKRRKFRQEDAEGSISADAFYNNPASIDGSNKIQNKIQNSNQNTIKTFSRKTNTENGLAVMHGYEHISKQARAMSPEALKVRRAPAILQSPTIV